MPYLNRQGIAVINFLKYYFQNNSLGLTQYFVRQLEMGD